MKTLFKIKRSNIIATVKADDNFRLYVTYSNTENRSEVVEYDHYKREIERILSVIKVGFCMGYEKRKLNGRVLDGQKYTLWSY